MVTYCAGLSGRFLKLLLQTQWSLLHQLTVSFTATSRNAAKPAMQKRNNQSKTELQKLCSILRGRQIRPQALGNCMKKTAVTIQHSLLIHLSQLQFIMSFISQKAKHRACHLDGSHSPIQVTGVAIIFISAFPLLIESLITGTKGHAQCSF